MVTTITLIDFLTILEIMCLLACLFVYFKCDIEMFCRGVTYPANPNVTKRIKFVKIEKD